MTFDFEFSAQLEKKVTKLGKKDRALAISLRKKIQQIIEMDKDTIDNFKNLKHDMKHFKRVHIRSFVLVFRLEGNTVMFEDFDHHDKIYR